MDTVGRKAFNNAASNLTDEVPPNTQQLATTGINCFCLPQSTRNLESGTLDKKNEAQRYFQDLFLSVHCLPSAGFIV